MGRKRNIVKEFMDYYAGLSADARKVVRDLLYESGTATAPQPRQSAGSAERTTKPPLMCAYVFPDDGRPYGGLICTAEQNGIIHKDPKQTGYHKFVKPRKSSTKKRAGLPVETCAYLFPEDGEEPTLCGRIEDNPVHRKDGGYAGYHPFKSKSFVVVDAQPPLLANGAGSGGGVETESVAATGD